MSRVSLVLLAAALLPLPGSAQSPHADPPLVTPADRRPINYALLQTLLTAKRPILTFRPDDIITVQIFGIENYALKQRVADDGTIVFPLIGRTPVAGLTTEQLQASIADALQTRGMVQNAQVSIVAELRPAEIVSVLGDVVKPGIFPAVGQLTIADYLSQASGFVESAPGNQASSSADYTVTLIRPSLPEPVLVPLGPERANAAWGRIPVFAGDQIRVDKVGLIYAVGAFKQQGSFQLKNTNKTTVSQLVALAGGMGYEAASADSHIVRRQDGQTTVIDLNVGKILKGTDPDLTLESEDILFVPTNKMKAAIKGGGPSLIVSLASAALFRY